VKRVNRSPLEIPEHYAEGRLARVEHEMKVVGHDNVGEKKTIVGGTDYLQVV
jgi:hypothetical protein